MEEVIGCRFRGVELCREVGMSTITQFFEKIQRDAYAHNYSNQSIVMYTAIWMGLGIMGAVGDRRHPSHAVWWLAAGLFFALQNLGDMTLKNPLWRIANRAAFTIIGLSALVAWHWGRW